MNFRARGVVLAALAAAVASLLSGVANAETVMITGANSGIGLEFTKQYAAKGWTIVATHRRKDVPKSLAEVVAKYPKVRVETLDVTNLDSVQALVSRLGGMPIDVLINNAGVYNDRRKCASEDESCPGDWTTQGFGKMDFTLLDTIMDVNVKGPLIVTQAFYDNVKKSGLKKIVAISSSNGTLTGENPPRPGAIFYRTSKAALNRSMQIVASSVKPDGVTVIMFNPGPTLTERQSYLKDSPIMIKTSFTVENMVRTIDKVTINDTGKFLRYDGQPEAW
jgi:NAD(P)-dependent dehydrogenase (short-subunit alcohol dehydrogenase family)